MTPRNKNKAQDGCVCQNETENAEANTSCGCRSEHDEQIEKLTKEVSHWEQQYNKALATAAHHENLSRYYKAELDRAFKYRSQDFIEKLIPVLDSFQMAFMAKSNSPEVEAYKMGFEFILRMFKTSLEAEGVKEIRPQIGDQYDENLHHAVETVEVETEGEVGKITKVLLSGYQLLDHNIRAANVSVTVLKVKPLDEVKETPTTEETKNSDATPSNEEEKVNPEDFNKEEKKNG